MAVPRRKSPKVESLIDSANPSGRSRVASIEADACAWCGKPAIIFKGETSRIEYTISGLCQECRDKTFIESF